MDSEQLKYQDRISTEAANKIIKHGIVYLCMEMRTGKTGTAFMTCHKLNQSGGKIKNILMVSKKKALSSLHKDKEIFGKEFNFYCTNYEQIHNIDFDPDIIFVDEAHSFGQFPKPALRTKRLKDLAEGKPIIYLSGTPTPESYSQLYHQLWISSYSPFKEYKNFYGWARDYVFVRNKYLGQIVIKDYSGANIDKVKKATDHLFISMTQKDAGFKQEIQEEVVSVKMNPTTLALINKLKNDRVYIGKDGSEIVAESEVKLMNKIHQISSGTVIVENGPDNAKVFDMSKAYYIRDHYKGFKIAIYYKFVAERAALIMAIGSDRLTDDPDEFNSSKDKWFFSQVQSGREGVGLPTADYIVMYNIDFSAVSYFQVRSRFQEKNRIKPAIVHWLFSDIGMENKIFKAVSNKKDYTLSYFRKDYLIPGKEYLKIK